MKTIPTRPPINHAPLLATEEWTEFRPRVEIVSTSYLYEELMSMFIERESPHFADTCSKAVLATTLYSWSVRNHLIEPCMPMMHPGIREPAFSIRAAEDIFYHYAAFDPDLMDAISKLTGDEYPERFDRVVKTLCRQLDDMYPTTGRESLARIGIAFLRWAGNDMVLKVS